MFANISREVKISINRDNNINSNFMLLNLVEDIVSFGEGISTETKRVVQATPDVLVLSLLAGRVEFWVVINGGKHRIPQERQEYINISGYTPTPAQEQTLKMGLNCHYMTRPRPTDTRLKDMKVVAKELKQVARVTVRRADKTAAFVLIDTEEYHKKLDDILADSSKFVRLTRNPIEDTKREANRTIEAVNAATNTIHLPLAKRLNVILTPYISNRYCVTASAEFLEKIKDSTCDGVIASMDVESLFTNVPMDETIDLITDRVYRDDSTPTMNISEPPLRTLLAICTKRAPFTTHRGHTYLQKDGVAMGSPLGVLFANFYKGVVEERVFSRVECPFLYFRYIEDTFVKAGLSDEIETLRRTFEDHSHVQKEVRKAVDKWYEPAPAERPDSSNNIKLFYKGHMYPNYLQDEKAMKEIIKNNVFPTEDTKKLDFIKYYQTTKTKSLIMRNNPAPPEQDFLKKTNIIYAYQCPFRGCPGNYIGKTTMRLSKRISCHAQQGSIKNHALQRHNIHIYRADIVSNTKIIGGAPDRRCLRILETLLIQRDKPTLNTTKEMSLLPSSCRIDTSRNPHHRGPNEDTSNHENTPNFDARIGNDLGHVGQFAEQESSLAGSERASANQNSGLLMTSQTGNPGRARRTPDTR
ncbi:uncharacterized protein [Palaemon carinicauda]|uniref:uncharacterized protein n=1 Tax=Palaemon carinicauda TaxID=392227 RepID=UPI0035B5A325